MLIRFNVKNFLSFDKQADGKSEEFTMVAGKVQWLLVKYEARKKDYIKMKI